MATFTVTTLLDVVNEEDGFLSLREAVTLSNADSSFDTIEFAMGMRGTVNLTLGRLELTQSVTISGDTNFEAKTPDITIDGSGNNAGPGDGGVFLVSNNAVASFNSLIITGGDAGSGAGGGISAASGTSVFVQYSTITGNSASTGGGGGIYAAGALTISSSTVSDNHGGYGAGGILARGDLTIVNSTISGNDSGNYAGGIAFGVSGATGTGKLSIVNSTISDNTTSGTSYAFPTTLGGGLVILNTTSTATLINVTVSGNEAGAGGGIYNGHHDLRVYTSTITDNTVTAITGDGSGIFDIAGGNSIFFNSIVAGNHGAPDIKQAIDGSSYLGFNNSLVGNAGDNPINAFQSTIGTPGAPIDPMLAPLAPNFFGVPTRAILAGSPLRNAGSTNYLPDDPYNPGHDLGFDGNFYPRVQGAGLDIGAVEFANQWTVTSASDIDSIGSSVVADLADNGGLTLREALYWAESGATISFASNLAGSTIRLQSRLQLTKDVGIDGQIIEGGSPWGDITLSGDKNGNETSDIGDVGIMTVNSGVTAGLSGLRFYLGRGFTPPAGPVPYTSADNAASAILNNGTLSITDSVFVGNYARAFSGASGSEGGGVAAGNGGHAGTIVNTGNLSVANLYFNYNTAIGGDGGNGGNSDDAFTSFNSTYFAVRGSDGGNGGHAAAGILQLGGSLTMHHLEGHHNANYATGGQGGNGGQGGDGIYNGMSNYLANPGNGGDGGDGGKAGLVVVLAGSASGNMAFYGVNATGGNGGFEGLPGEPARPTDPIGNAGQIGAPGSTGPLVVAGGASNQVSHLVTNANDSDVGSLRYAIEHAHAGDTIRFADWMNGAVISLDTELEISQDLTIVGDIDGDFKADITLSGRGANRIFSIEDSGTDVLLGGLTLTSGFAANGGAINTQNGTTLKLVHSTVTNSSATHAGGGIWVGGQLTVANSTIDHNAAANYGGGLYVSGSQFAQFVNTTIAYNSQTSGGGLHAGGGVDTGDNASLTFVGSTITKNWAAGVGGGVDLYNNADLILMNTIVSGNTVGEAAASNFNKFSGTTIFALNSLVGAGDAALLNTNTNNQFADDPLLGQLLDNGGTVLTMSPLDASASLVWPPTDSLAIGNGDNASIGFDILDLNRNGYDVTEDTPFDARMLQRILGTRVDIGAVEWTVDERIRGNDASNTIMGGVGRDTIMGGLGSDHLDGGDGIDTVDYSDKTIAVTVMMYVPESSPYATIGEEYDSLHNFENVIGGSAGDIVQDNEHANRIEGRAGNDIITSMFGNDTVDGGADNDTVSFKDRMDGAFVVLDADGNATMSFQGNSFFPALQTVKLISIENVVGTAVADSMTGNAKANRFEGWGGNDTFKGGLGNDTMIGGNDFDTADYSDKTVKVTIALDGDGDATVVFAGETDQLLDMENLIGGSAGDSFTGNGSANTFAGNGGDDTFKGGLGKDSIDGGAGTGDIADLSDRANKTIKVTLAKTAYADVYIGGTTAPFIEDKIKNVEGVIGANLVDTLTGDALANYFKGMAGKDVLDGKDGLDTADYSDKASKVTVTLNAGTQVDVYVGGTTSAFREDKIKNIENLIGGSKDDTFTGDTKANIFKGLAGKDVFDGKTGLDTADYSEKTAKITVTLKGATQTDVKVGTANEDKIKNIEVIIGGSVADSLTGDDFANVFVGNGGNDTLIGGLGNDTLTGGTGADHFRFNTVPHSTKNVDRITDFAAGDKISIENSVFDVGTGLASNEFISKAGHTFTSNTQRLIYDQTAHELWYDANGKASGGAGPIKVAIFDSSVASLALGDFVIV